VRTRGTSNGKANADDRRQMTEDRIQAAGDEEEEWRGLQA
jgi:hypothetical protein